MLRCVYVARLICSDESCADQARGAQNLEELDTLVCACGCAPAVIGWPNHLDEPAAHTSSCDWAAQLSCLTLPHIAQFLRPALSGRGSTTNVRPTAHPPDG